ncbi:hypothetical protein Poli38472_007796 [Pythium oligandrum]|uniref:UBA domain-containing protein n=1 Tax=Pythium oligandrum TaxID=41045 RepID=A0A8K1CR85_PYTOL|nr:hypothetical protein Poli38472_007796 [Pythium oligandrum]|eukprot:TMW68124.1 hypothetical protein Poli38472_007796 [Pythium oligandrum]
MHGDLRGFYGAPVTYALSMTVGAASSATVLFNYGRFFKLDRELVVRHGHLWRLFSSQLAFHHGLAAAFGIYIIFQYRVLERQMGSRKFGSLLFFVLFITAALQMSALLSLPMMLARRLPPGPYALLGALTIFYLKFVPRLQPKAYSLLGLHLSDKSSTYFLLLVILARNPRTLLAFLPGMFLGVLFSSTPLSKLRLPSFVCTILSIFHPFFEVVPASLIAQQRQRRLLEVQRRLAMRNQNQNGAAAGADAQGFRDQLLPGAGGVAPGVGGGMMPPRMVATPPSEDAIQQLLALGFDRERAIAALQATDNNVEAAANRLLNGL